MATSMDGPLKMPTSFPLVFTRQKERLLQNLPLLVGQKNLFVLKRIETGLERQSKTKIVVKGEEKKKKEKKKFFVSIILVLCVEGELHETNLSQRPQLEVPSGKESPH